MQPIPANITQFFQTNHVVSIATYADGTIWSACCFYVFDEPAARLIVLTSQKTKHGRLMAANPHIAGTVAGQPGSITKISGIQFTARARLLEDDGLLSISETAGDPDKLDQQELIALLATHGFTPVRQYGNRRNYTVNFAVADTKR